MSSTFTSNGLVASVRLFGSAFRKEIDDLSDIDVLVVYSRAPSQPERADIRSTILDRVGTAAEIAEYEEQRIRDFFELGDLFAWHLHYESRPLLDKTDNFFSSLPHPRRYAKAGEDTRQFAIWLTASLAR